MPRCGARQLAKLQQLRARATSAPSRRRLPALDRRQRTATATCSTSPSRRPAAKATVGEISDALEKAFGRHVAEIRSHLRRLPAGGGRHPTVASTAFGAKVEAFARGDGRRPRILVAKMGQDGHDRGQKVIASAFADLGFDVIVGAMFQTPEEVAQARPSTNDVHIVGASSLAAGHLTLVPELKAALDQAGGEDIMIVVGGVIPPQDFDALRRGGRGRDIPAGHGDRGSGGEPDRAVGAEGGGLRGDFDG